MRNNDKFFSKLLTCGLTLLAVDFFYLLALNAVAVFGAVICFAISYGIFACFVKFNKREISSLEGNALFLFTFGWVGFASILVAHGNLLTYGNYLSAMGDDMGFLMNAQHFAESGQITYSIFDWFTGVLYYIYQSIGLPVDALCLLPINWGAASLVVVILYALVARMLGGVTKPMLFCCGLIGNYTFMLVSFLFVRDILGVLFFVWALSFAFSRRPISAGVASFGALLVRGANGLLGFALIPFGFFANWFAGKRGLLLLCLIVATVIAFYFGSYASAYYGSVFRARSISYYSLIEGRAAMMQRQDDMTFAGGGRFDMTMMFYQLGPVGVPFRYVTNVLAPIRMVGSEGMVRVQGQSPKHKMFGKWWRSKYQNLYILLVPFVAPYLFYGIFTAFRDPRYNSYFFAFMMVLTAIVLFSLQDRHKAMFVVFYPVFIELGARAVLKDRSQTLVRLAMIGLVGLLYPLNFYLMLR